MKRAALFIIFTVMLYGCGYTARSVLPAGEASIHVDNFVNKIDVTEEVSKETPYYAYRPAMESDVTREIIDKFIFDGNYKIEGPKSAGFLLKGDLVDFRRDPLRYDANENVIEYRVSVVVDMELHDLKKGKLAWREKRFAGESTYRTSGQLAKSETTALQEALEDLADRIVERTVENW
jgi:hypothetical protein